MPQSQTLFATKSDVEELKNDFLSKLSDLREEFTSVKCPPAPVVSSPSESDDVSTQFPLSQVSPSSTLTQTPTSSQNKNVSASGQVHKAVDKPNPGKAPSRKVLIAGDSLLNRMHISKMKVSDIPSVKLTKRGDNLSVQFLDVSTMLVNTAVKPLTLLYWRVRTTFQIEVLVLKS